MSYKSGARVNSWGPTGRSKYLELMRPFKKSQQLIRDEEAIRQYSSRIDFLKETIAYLTQQKNRLIIENGKELKEFSKHRIKETQRISQLMRSHGEYWEARNVLREIKKELREITK